MSDMNPVYFETRFLKELHFQDWPPEFVIITAYATTGEDWTPERNRDADRQLEERLEALRCWRLRLTGYSSKTGHAEPGWAAALPLDAACDLGVHFHQDAIYHVLSDVLSVTYCDHRRKLIRIGVFRERVDLESAQDL